MLKANPRLTNKKTSILYSGPLCLEFWLIHKHLNDPIAKRVKSSESNNLVLVQQHVTLKRCKQPKATVYKYMGICPNQLFKMVSGHRAIISS